MKRGRSGSGASLGGPQKNSQNATQPPSWATSYRAPGLRKPKSSGGCLSQASSGNGSQPAEPKDVAAAEVPPRPPSPAAPQPAQIFVSATSLLRGGGEDGRWPEPSASQPVASMQERHSLYNKALPQPEPYHHHVAEGRWAGGSCGVQQESVSIPPAGHFLNASNVYEAGQAHHPAGLHSRTHVMGPCYQQQEFSVPPLLHEQGPQLLGEPHMPNIGRQVPDAPTGGQQGPGLVIMSAKELLAASCSQPTEPPAVFEQWPSSSMSEVAERAQRMPRQDMPRQQYPQQAQPHGYDVQAWAAPPQPTHDASGHLAAWQPHADALPLVQAPTQTGPVHVMQQAQHQTWESQPHASAPLYVSADRADTSSLTGVAPVNLMPGRAASPQARQTHAPGPTYDQQAQCILEQQWPQIATMAIHEQQQAHGDLESQHHIPQRMSAPQGSADLWDGGGVQLLTPGGHQARPPEQQQVCQQALNPAPASVGRQPLRQLLSQWVNHEGVVAAYAAKGVKSLYPWQAGALECGEDGGNLVYCAPTSGGKSLVAEVLMVRQLLARSAGVRPPAFGQRRQPPPRAMLVLPYISIVHEKTEHMASILAPLGLGVRGYYGAAELRAPFSDPDECLAVMTMEKANVTINRLLSEGRLHELCCIVVDEAHMVSDPHRGLVLELLLTKVRHFAQLAAEGASSAAVAAHIQIIAMSATMSGLPQMCAWLDAHLFMTNFRPVPLTEHAVFGRTVFRKRQLGELRALQQKEKEQAAVQVVAPNTAPGLPSTQQPAATAASCSGPLGSATGQAPNSTTSVPGAAQLLVQQRQLPEALGRRDKDGLVHLVAEVVAEGHSVLVFCSSRAACEAVGALLAELLPQALPVPWPADVMAKRRALLADLDAASAGQIKPQLRKMIEAGVAFHHAGLTSQERSAVEGAYRRGRLLVLTATSTLAAGINLPARRVILRSLAQGIGPVSRAQYLQMIGRAGRAGQSAVGESFIMGTGAPNAAAGEWGAISALMQAALPALRSCLLDRPDGVLLPSTAAEAGGKPPVSGRGSGPKSGPPQQGSAKLSAGAGAPQLPPTQPSSAPSLAALPPGTGLQPQPTMRPSISNGSAGRPLQDITNMLGGAHLPRASGASGAGHQAGPCSQGSVGSGGSLVQRGGGQAPGSQSRASGPPAPVGSQASGGHTTQGAAVAAIVQQAGAQISMPASSAQQGADEAGVGPDPCKKQWVAVPAHETHLQRILLESIANGSVSTGPTIATLLTSTLLFQQIKYSCIAAATQAALRNLIAAKLITVQAEPATPHQEAPQRSGPGRQPGQAGRGTPQAPQVAAPKMSRFVTTKMGRAVYDSALPTHTAMELYGRLKAAQESGIVLAAAALHLTYLINLDTEGFEIFSWKEWARVLKSMSPGCQAVAKAERVTHDLAERMHMGYRGMTSEDHTRHTRFAAALCLHQLIEGDSPDEDEAWRQPKGILTAGVSKAALQRMQSQLSKTAGMVAQMAGSAGWWQLEILCGSLSEVAAAGARPELLPLMQVPDMTAARARALYGEGIRTPAQLAVAAEESVMRAVTAALPRNMRLQQNQSKAQTKHAATAAHLANAGTVTMASRATKQLIEAARRHVVAEMQAQMRALKEEEARAGSDPQETAALLVSTPGLLDRPADALTAEELELAFSRCRPPAAGAPGPAQASTAVMAPGHDPASAVRGTARITTITAATPPEALDGLLAAIATAPRLAITPVLGATKPQGDGAADQKGPTPPTLLGLAIAWSDDEAAWIKLGPDSARAVDRASLFPRLLEALCASPTPRPLAGFSMRAALVALQACGLPLLTTLSGTTSPPGNAAAAAATNTPGTPEVSHPAGGDVHMMESGQAQTQAGGLQTKQPAHLAGRSAAQLSLHDVQHMFWLLYGGSTGLPVQAVTLKAVQQGVLPGYRLRVPNLESGSATLAVRTALVSHAACHMLPALLAHRRLLSLYTRVEAPLLLGLATSDALACAHLIHPPPPQATPGQGPTPPGAGGSSTAAGPPQQYEQHSFVGGALGVEPHRLGQPLAWMSGRIAELRHVIRCLLPGLDRADVSSPAGVARVCAYLGLTQSPAHPDSCTSGRVGHSALSSLLTTGSIPAGSKGAEPAATTATGLICPPIGLESRASNTSEATSAAATEVQQELAGWTMLQVAEACSAPHHDTMPSASQLQSRNKHLIDNSDSEACRECSALPGLTQRAPLQGQLGMGHQAFCSPKPFLAPPPLPFYIQSAPAPRGVAHTANIVSWALTQLHQLTGIRQCVTSLMEAAQARPGPLTALSSQAASQQQHSIPTPSAGWPLHVLPSLAPGHVGARGLLSSPAGPLLLLLQAPGAPCPSGPTAALAGHPLAAGASFIDFVDLPDQLPDLQCSLTYAALTAAHQCQQSIQTLPTSQQQGEGQAACPGGVVSQVPCSQAEPGPPLKKVCTGEATQGMLGCPSTQSQASSQVRDAAARAMQATAQDWVGQVVLFDSSGALQLSDAGCVRALILQKGWAHVWECQVAGQGHLWEYATENVHPGVPVTAQATCSRSPLVQLLVGSRTTEYDSSQQHSSCSLRHRQWQPGTGVRSGRLIAVAVPPPEVLLPECGYQQPPLPAAWGLVSCWQGAKAGEQSGMQPPTSSHQPAPTPVGISASAPAPPAPAQFLMLVPLDRCWLHGDCSGPGSLDSALRRDVFQQLHAVQLLASPTACIVPVPACLMTPVGGGVPGGGVAASSPVPPGLPSQGVPHIPALVVLRARLMHLPLALVSHASGDPLLKEAMSSPQPLARIAYHWLRATQGQAPSDTNLEAIGSDLSAASGPVGAPRPSSLPSLMARVGPGCAAQGAEWVARHLVLSLSLGEGPAQLANRLAQPGPGRHAPKSSKAAAKELLASFLSCFQGLQRHMASLVDQAKADAGHIRTLAGRRVVNEVAVTLAGARARVTPSVAARLQRDLLREEVGWGVADIQRTAAALAISTGDAEALPSSASDTASQYGDQAAAPSRVMSTSWPIQLVGAAADGDLLFLVPGSGSTGGPAPAVARRLHAAMTAGVEQMLSLNVPLACSMWWGHSLDRAASVPITLS